MDDVWNGEHLRRIRTWLFDGGIAGSVLYVTLVERGLEPAVVAIGLVMAAAMLGRRRYPVTVACVVYTAAPLHLLFDDTMRLYDVAVLISMFAVVKYRAELVWGILAGVGAGLGVVIGAALEARRTDNFGTIAWVVGALTVAVWFSAYGVRTRQLYVASLEERAATLERERDHLARLAAADERAAIARELHDVVAHSLSVMIVQADGAGYTLDPSASGARQALDTIAATGRDALEDMARVVSVLRGASPAPGDAARRRVGLAELDRLVERAGLRVDLETAGTPAGLSVAEELTTYRIVQESLTNTLRHAGPDAKVALRLEYAPGHVTIVATDDGAGHPTAATSTRVGHGLAGMRERVALHGGTVTAGPRFDGGWTVTATIPRTSQPATTAAPVMPGAVAVASATPGATAEPLTPGPAAGAPVTTGAVPAAEPEPATTDLPASATGDSAGMVVAVAPPVAPMLVGAPSTVGTAAPAREVGAGGQAGLDGARAGGMAGADGTADAGGIAGADGMADAGGMVGAGGIAGPGGEVGAGGMAGADGTADAGGIAGAGGVVGARRTASVGGEGDAGREGEAQVVDRTVAGAAGSVSSAVRPSAVTTVSAVIGARLRAVRLGGEGLRGAGLGGGALRAVGLGGEALPGGGLGGAALLGAGLGGAALRAAGLSGGGLRAVGLGGGGLGGAGLGGAGLGAVEVGGGRWTVR